MGNMHSLIERHGAITARTMVPQDQHDLFDVAAAALSDDALGENVTYSGFASVGLPHRDPKNLVDKDGRLLPWERTSGGFTLTVEPGYLKVSGENRLFGVPYGSKARLILLYLQTSAHVNGSPIVEMGRSLNEWMTSLGVSTGGSGYKTIKEQCHRIAACTLTFYYDNGTTSPDFNKARFIKAGRLIPDAKIDDRQFPLFQEKVELDSDFYNFLMKHPVPVLESAIKLIANNSFAIDLYLWLAYRLPRIDKPDGAFVTYKALMDQFGFAYNDFYNFRDSFRDALRLALAVYPDAEVEIEGKGIRLRTSPPPVARERTRARLHAAT